MRVLGLCFSLILIGGGIAAYWQTFATTSSVPPDSIYLATGLEGGRETIRTMSEFRFIAYAAESRIQIILSGQYSSGSKLHHFYFYLPFVVTFVRGQTYSDQIDIATKYYLDTVDGRCTLVIADISGKEDIWGFQIAFNIYVKELAAVRRMGEQTVILTFGFPSSDRYWSLVGSVEENMVEISVLFPLSVTVGAGRSSFFLPSTYPDPDVEYLTEDYRFATWLLNFSGPLSSYYRSIHCTVGDSEMSKLRELYIFVSGLLIPTGVSLFGLAARSLSKEENKTGTCPYNKRRGLKGFP